VAAQTVELDARVVLAALPVPAHAFQPGMRIALHPPVLVILVRAGQAQVRPPVVQRVAVDVIHQHAGPGPQDDAMHELQRELAFANGQEAHGIAVCQHEPGVLGEV